MFGREYRQAAEAKRLLKRRCTLNVKGPRPPTQLSEARHNVAQLGLLQL
jgi:hypothetical protein